MHPSSTKQIDIGISIADADLPTIILEKGVLTLSFTDWTETAVQIVFSEVLGALWQDAEELLDDERYDQCVEVMDSPWAKLHIDQSIPSSPDKLRHLNLNFNACGKLSVLFEGSIDVIRPEA